MKGKIYPGGSVVRDRPLSTYTFEDYLKDFELDYLGFDGVPDKSAADPSSETISENEPAAKGDRSL